jgi:hypothetical protein
MKTIITLFIITRKLIDLDVLPKGNKYKQKYSVDSFLPDLKKANLSLHRRMPESTFCLHMDNSICNDGSDVMSNFRKHHASRSPRSPYSPDMAHVAFAFSAC